MFDRVLIANRAEIACRVIDTCRRLGVQTVAVYSEPDAGARHVRHADVAVALDGPPGRVYLDGDQIIAAALRTRAQAVHPGYGFLSEDARFARAVRDAGLTWIGPEPATIEAMGDKINSRNLMAKAGMPVADGTAAPVADTDAAVGHATKIGYPVMLKAAAGGGGIGMNIINDETTLRASFDSARERAGRLFGSPAILLERYLPRARHIEVQILGLADGRIVVLGERDCSIQRRHQKVAEETPAPVLSRALRYRMHTAAAAAAQMMGYRGAGTIECLVDTERQEFVFLEMNTRLQVEHPITELVWGLDLVAEQLRAAAGEAPGFDPEQARPAGHAIEFRIYAEDPHRFLPGPGTITAWRPPSTDGVRLDTGYDRDDAVTPHYDPLIAKLCVWGPDRTEALRRARQAIEQFEVAGPKCNVAFFLELLDTPEFGSGVYDTETVGRLRGGAAGARQSRQ